MSPIKILEHNITAKFEFINSYSSDRFKEYVTQGKIKPYIKWDSSSYFYFPKADLTEKCIILNEKFLEFIWMLIYSHWVLYEEDHMKNELNITKGGNIPLNIPLIKRAQALRVVCKSFGFLVHGWDLSFPNPDQTDSVDQFFVERVNGIFQDSIALFLYHEFAHIICNHKPYTAIPAYESVEQEKEADNYALQVYLEGRETDSNKVQSGLAILFTYISPFFITQHPNALQCDTHPDTDTRFYNALQRVGLQTDEEQYYFYKFALTLIHDFLVPHTDFLNQNGLFFPQEQVETAKDLFEQYVDILERAKMLIH
jgi:hypothetical protein